MNDEKYWFELEEDRYANRQIVLDECNEYHISCMEDCLAEGPVNETDLVGEITYISEQEFEDVWQLVLKKYRKQWEEIKKKYPIGTCVQGVNCYIYPQGSIIKGEDFVAVYKGNEPFHLRKVVHHTIKMYDDVNMWLVVE